MTEIEQLENKLYNKYIEIKKNKKQKIRIEIKTAQEQLKMQEADETGVYFNPNKYWNEKRKEILKKKVNATFEKKGLEEKTVNEAIKLFCDEMNAHSQFYEITVQKVMKGDYHNAKNELKANQLKYGYHFIIKPKVQSKKNVTVTKKAEKVLNEKELADELLKKNLASLAAYRAKLKALQEQVKDTVNGSMDEQIKKVLEKKHKKGSKNTKIEKISSQDVKEALETVRSDAINLSGEANLNLHTSEYIRYLIKDAKHMSDKLGGLNTTDRVYNIHSPKEEILDVLNASDEFIEAYGDSYFGKQNEFADAVNKGELAEELDDDLDDLFVKIKEDAIWEDDKDIYETEKDKENKLTKLDKEIIKEKNNYDEQNRRDLIYVMEHAKKKLGLNVNGGTNVSYPFKGVTLDDNGNKVADRTTLIDTFFVGKGNLAKQPVSNAVKLNNSPEYADTNETWERGLNVLPNQPVWKITEVIDDNTKSSTGELLEQIFLYGFLAADDDQKYPEEVAKQKDFKLHHIQTHTTETAHDFVDHNRKDSELQIFTDWLKETFGEENWKHILNTYDYSDLKKAQKYGDEIISERINDYKLNHDFERQTNNFIKGSASAIANDAMHKAKIMFDKATKMANVKNVTPITFNFPIDKVKKITGVVGIEGAAAAIKKMQNPSKAYKRIVPKSGQQILGDQIFNLDYIEINRIQDNSKSSVSSSTISSNYEVSKSVAEKKSYPLKRVYVRKSGLKPFILPKKALKNLFIKNQYGDILAACFFQILVSNTPIDEPYSGFRKRKYYTSGNVSPYKDIVVNGIEVAGVNKTAEEIYQERESNRQEKYYYEYFEHVPDSSAVRNDWEFIYKGKVFKPTDEEFKGCFDKKADLNSIKTIKTVFQKHSFDSKLKSISFSYQNTNPRWEQLEYGGYQQNENSGPYKGQGKYGFLHGVTNHFTYQAPNGWLRLIEAQWNLVMESGFDIKCVEDFINQQGFNATEAGKEIIEQFNIKPREYDYKNFKVIGVV